MVYLLPKMRSASQFLDPQTRGVEDAVGLQAMTVILVKNVREIISRRLCLGDYNTVALLPLLFTAVRDIESLSCCYTCS